MVSSGTCRDRLHISGTFLPITSVYIQRGGKIYSRVIYGENIGISLGRVGIVWVVLGRVGIVWLVLGRVGIVWLVLGRVGIVCISLERVGIVCISLGRVGIVG